MSKYHVTYYYLATGMEGEADTRDYGLVEAPTAKIACEIIAERDTPDNELRDWIMGCLHAKLVSEEGSSDDLSDIGATPWTVVGVYEKCGSTFYYNIPNAKDAHEAMRIAAGDTHYDSDLCIIGAIAGDHELIDACEDSKKSCYACDLEPEDNE